MAARDRVIEEHGGIDQARETPEWTAAQAEVERCYDGMYREGYFQDSYNSSSVLWTLGLSWWEDVTPMLNPKGYMTPAKTKKFLKMVQEAEQARLPTDWEQPIAEVRKYFQDKRRRLERFLQQAINLDEPILMSL